MTAIAPETPVLGPGEPGPPSGRPSQAGTVLANAGEQGPMASSQRFSIDEARQPFDVDMAAKIRVVEEAGRALIVAPGCSGATEALTQACQSIAHSSALVGARS